MLFKRQKSFAVALLVRSCRMHGPTLRPCSWAERFNGLGESRSECGTRILGIRNCFYRSNCYRVCLNWSQEVKHDGHTAVLHNQQQTTGTWSVNPTAEQGDWKSLAIKRPASVTSIGAPVVVAVLGGSSSYARPCNTTRRQSKTCQYTCRSQLPSRCVDTKGRSCTYSFYFQHTPVRALLRTPL